ncbi:MAG: hypothetical protein K2X47_01080, partial [Bdellovibrionales bacterium]|nr:hypothetical protein [Bdellovibrionales bacterium]
MIRFACAILFFLILELFSFVFLTEAEKKYSALFGFDISSLISKLNMEHVRSFETCVGSLICSEPDLGWWSAPGKSGELGFGTVTNDTSGSRTFPGQNRVSEIATYGDSFTQGTEVADDGTWQAQFERKFQIGLKNFGVMGFRPDQALV